MLETSPFFYILIYPLRLKYTEGIFWNCLGDNFTQTLKIAQHNMSFTSKIANMTIPD